MKIKEITEGILGKVADKVAGAAIPKPGQDQANPYGAFAQQIDRNPYGSFSQQLAKTIRDAGGGNPFKQYLKTVPRNKQRDGTSVDTDTDTDTTTDTTTDTQQSDTDTQQTDTDAQQSQQPDPRPDPVDTEAEKANANIKSKIDYLVKQGVLQSGRITDTERQYIDSVDVYVDPNKFANAEPSQIILKARPPHVSNYTTSVSMPLSAWQEALGRDGSGLRGNVGFNLTPAGWWSDDYKGYINPNSKLDDLISQYQK